MTELTIYAMNMIYAQGVKLTAEQRAELSARADRYRAILGTDEKQSFQVPVRYAREPHELLGYMTYQA